MKQFYITICVLTVALSSYGQEKNKKIYFDVDGVCEMCKMRIEKAVLGVSGVKFASWDIPSHQLSLIVDERKTNSMAIKSVLATAGHDTKELKATQEAYDDLHPCCKYRDIDAEESENHRQ
ncbi:MAG: heavy-metal-associated domain-containing protein [Croceivirga sp.]